MLYFIYISRKLQLITISSIVKTYQRGSFMTILLSIIRNDNNFTVITTDPINVNGMAVIVIKSKGLSEPQYHIEQSIKFKKSDNTNNTTVIIDITSIEFNKQFICQDEWVEVPMIQRKQSAYVNATAPYALFYVTEINITVHAKMPVASSIWNKFYEETEFTDFKLQGEDGTVPVHKSVLYVHSEMFRTMLRGKWKETEEDTMKMSGVTVQTLQHLKEYMYLGTVPDEGLEPLIVLAKRCLMDNLAAGCIDKLFSSVKAETFDGLVEFACQNNIPELMRALVLRIPDDVVNGICKMKIENEKEEEGEEPTDKK